METNDIILIVLGSVGLPLEVFLGLTRGKFGLGPAKKGRHYSNFENINYAAALLAAVFIPIFTGLFVIIKISGQCDFFAGIGTVFVYCILSLILYIAADHYALENWYRWP